jgi:hypothetical protein
MALALLSTFEEFPQAVAQMASLRQNNSEADLPQFTVQSVNEKDLTLRILQDFLATVTDSVVGISPVYGSKCALTTLAFSTISRVLIIHICNAQHRPKPKGKPKRVITASSPLSANILCSPDLTKCGFRMDRLAASLHLDLGQRIAGGFDVRSMCQADRHSWAAFMAAHKVNVEDLFQLDECESATANGVASRAWAACQAGIAIASKPTTANGANIPRPSISTINLNVKVQSAS